MNRTLTVGLVALAATLAACSGSNLSWVFQFADRASADRAVTVEGRVREGGCDGAVIWSARATRSGASDMSPPELSPGTYGLEGVAIDGDCVEFADGCVEITIPASSDEPTTITLTASSESAQCPPAECVAGTCSATGDGGMDAPTDTPTDTAADVPGDGTDTGAGDADVGVDAEDTSVDVGCMDDADCTGGSCLSGTCCFGCVVFGACVSGDDDGACGRGGGACDTCTCPTDSCNAGTCEVGHPISALATASNATCAMSGGQLYCWGSNVYGELAVGAVGADRPTPQTAGTSLAFDTLGDGDDHLLALEGGQLYTWGHNADGQLGLGDTANRTLPVRVGAASTWTVVEGALGGDSACAIQSGGTLYCWGQASAGELGIGTAPSSVTAPTMVAGTWVDITLGHHFTCGIQSDGTLWCWGANDLGQLGLGDAGVGTNRLSPTRVGTESDWTRVAAGEFHTCGLRGAGSLWCWGQNDDAHLGLGHTLTTIYSPTQVGTETDWIDVEGGEDHTCGLRAGGSLWCWGINSSGQCAVPASGGSDVRVPTRVGTETGWSQLNLGLDFGCVVRSADDSLHCWGRNETGALGLGDVGIHETLQPVCW